MTDLDEPATVSAARETSLEDERRSNAEMGRMGLLAVLVSRMPVAATRAWVGATLEAGGGVCSDTGVSRTSGAFPRAAGRISDHDATRSCRQTERETYLEWPFSAKQTPLI